VLRTLPWRSRMGVQSVSLHRRSTIASARPDIDAAALHQSTGAHRHVLFHHIQWEAL
jgi:hypothetical protein